MLSVIFSTHYHSQERMELSLCGMEGLLHGPLENRPRSQNHVYHVVPQLS
jgi:hypothetical protein